MESLWDKLVIVHADLWALNKRKNIREVEEYTSKIRELVWIYLGDNKEVIFTRISKDIEDISYLKDFYSQIIWIPRDEETPNVSAQANFVKNKLNLNKKQLIETAWWFEFACYKRTVAGILWISVWEMREEVRNWIIKYTHKDWKWKIIWVARKDLIF